MLRYKTVVVFPFRFTGFRLILYLIFAVFHVNTATIRLV
jgi:hypothetical protein